MEFDIQRLVWDKWNEEHISKHGLTRPEVDHVCYGRPIKYKESYKDRVLVIGRGADDRLITVVVGAVPDEPVGVFYPFSARPADRKERAFYANARRIGSSPTDG
jgi:uncharacterized DUF497 family protein